jgi:8-oxo-dGTP pyrophosphatase MutT (NUDIX family)
VSTGLHDRCASARRTLTAWVPPDAAQAALRDEFLWFLDAHDDATSRACRDGHLTASTLVVTPDATSVLLVAHPVVGRWLQLGGHCEPDDATLLDAAVREAREECGVDALTVHATPLRLDRHTVRCRRDDGSGEVDVLDHLDVQHVAVLDRDTAVQAEPRAQLQWFDLDALPADTDDAVRALVTAARRHLRAH